MSMAFKRFFTSFSLLLVMLSFSFSASADMSDSTFGAWMSAATRAAEITIESTLPYTAPVLDVLINPFNLNEGVYTAINYTFPQVNLETPSMALEAYLQRSHLTIRGDLVTIDGVDYRDIWVDNDFAQACRTNVLDLETAWEIASNSSGNITSSIGSFFGIPLFDISGTYKSQFYVIPDYGSYSFGSLTADVTFISSGGVSGSVWDEFQVTFHYPDGTSSVSTGRRFKNSQADTKKFFGLAVAFWNGQYNARIDTWRGSYPSGYFGAYASSSSFDSDSDPASFNWVARSIPASTLDSSDGIHLLVPADPNDFQDQSVQQTIRNFNTDLSTNFTFDNEIDLSTNFSLFNDLIGEISPIINITLPSYGPYGSSPTPSPTPTPVPSAPPEPTPAPTATPYDQIGTSPWSVLESWLQTIVEYLARIRLLLIDVLDTVRSLPDIISNGFHDVIDAIHDISVNIISGVEDAQIDFFDAAVDAIGDPFGDIWDAFQSVTSIWRYVVSWVGNISTPFAWSLSALGSAGGYFLSPFYAVAAAAIVLVIYKRFGK